MKSLLVVVVVIKIFNSIKFKRHFPENFFYLKCLIYLFISSIHSTFLTFTIPLGAILMGIFSVFDPKNRRLKLQMIYMGLFVIFLSLLSYSGIASTVQKGMLHWATYQPTQIDVYAYKNDYTSFLFSVTAPEHLEDWMTQLQASHPVTSYTHKSLGTTMGYQIKIHHAFGVTPLSIDPYNNPYANVFLGAYSLPFTNSSLVSFIDEIYSKSPSTLTINTSKDTSINITNATILSILWRHILWTDTSNHIENAEHIFSIPAYLFFEKYLGCRISFSDSFQYAYIENRGVLELPPALQSTLEEQFILSQLEQVNQLTTFEPAHIYTPSSSTQKFSILPDPTHLYHALYKHDFLTGEQTLLHTVQSSTAQYFLLKYPYILILDETSSKEPYLMLINQTIPGKHRYISKNVDVSSNSLSICPQNENFAYIITQEHTSVLHLVSNYYHSPKTIAVGDIQDCLFLSDQFLVFTQVMDNDQLLCVYDLVHNQVIKYTIIPGNIVLTQAQEGKVYFAVQQIDGLILREAQFFITSDLELQKVTSLP